METNRRIVTALMLAFSAAITCSAESKALNKAQIQAAPTDNPGVKTSGGYVETVTLNVKTEDGKSPTSRQRKELLKMLEEHGIKESTVWVDDNGVATWKAPAAINEDGTFSEDTRIVGVNANDGRSEMRKKGALPRLASQRNNPGKAGSGQSVAKTPPPPWKVKGTALMHLAVGGEAAAGDERVFTPRSVDGKPPFLWVMLLFPEPPSPAALRGFQILLPSGAPVEGVTIHSSMPQGDGVTVVAFRSDTGWNLSTKLVLSGMNHRAAFTTQPEMR